MLTFVGCWALLCMRRGQIWSHLWRHLVEAYSPKGFSQWWVENHVFNSDWGKPQCQLYVIIFQLFKYKFPKSSLIIGYGSMAENPLSLCKSWGKLESLEGSNQRWNVTAITFGLSWKLKACSRGLMWLDRLLQSSEWTESTICSLWYPRWFQVRIGL